MTPTKFNSYRVMSRALLALVIATIALASCSRTPQIHLDSRDHDLGDVTTPGRYSHVFTIRNTGTGTLVIEKVKPG